MISFTKLSNCVDVIFLHTLLTIWITVLQAIRFPQFHAICKIVQLLCRVRGFKHVMKLFPHEVSHLEMCLLLLRAQVIIEKPFIRVLSA